MSPVPATSPSMTDGGPLSVTSFDRQGKEGLAPILRPYQLEACNKILGAWKEFVRVLLVLPTAAGKMIVFASIVKTILALGKVLVLAHRDELLDQAQGKLAANGVRSQKEKASEFASLDADVVVASVQTLSRCKRLKRFDPRHFATIIVDECHHITAAGYQRILEHFPDANVLGVTATPDRADQRSLGEYFQTVAYEIGIVELIRQQHLPPIAVQNIPLQVDLRGVHIKAGDFDERDLGERIELVLADAAEAIRKYALQRRTLVFVPLVRTATLFAGILKAAGFNAEYISGKCKDRKEKLERFRSGETQVLVNSMLLTEGVDVPVIDCVLVLRPTRSRPLLCQMLGRGFRTFPGKKDLLVLDPLWMTSRHSVVRPVHLIAKDEKEALAIEKRLRFAGNKLVQAQELVERDRERSLMAAIKFNRGRAVRRIDLMQLELSLRAPGLSDFVPTMGWH